MRGRANSMRPARDTSLAARDRTAKTGSGAFMGRASRKQFSESNLRNFVKPFPRLMLEWRFAARNHTARFGLFSVYPVSRIDYRPTTQRTDLQIQISVSSRNFHAERIAPHGTLKSVHSCSESSGCAQRRINSDATRKNLIKHIFLYHIFSVGENISRRGSGKKRWALASGLGAGWWW